MRLRRDRSSAAIAKRNHEVTVDVRQVRASEDGAPMVRERFHLWPGDTVNVTDLSGTVFEFEIKKVL